jgi:hypothetical protein
MSDSRQKRFRYIPWEERWENRKKMLPMASYKEALELCHTRQELEEYARLKGYLPGWVDHVLEARQRAQHRNKDNG